MKKLLINSYYFYPDNTPRAFRTTELAKELIKQGYDVTIALPNRYSKYKNEIEKEIKSNNLIFCGKDITKLKNNSFNQNKKLRKFVSNIIKYFLSDKNIKYFYTNYSALSQNNDSFDWIISIGLPFYIHIGSYLFAKKNSIKMIADYGDPFSSNPAFKIAPYFKLIEKHILKHVEFITIPTKNSIKYYEKLNCNTNKIKIIPQGFDIDSIEVANYEKNKICTFAYAGLFYEKIRNPKKLFLALEKIQSNFKFIIYTDLSNTETVNCLREIPNSIKDKFVINDLLPRKTCIYELSKMDFLINLENQNSGQLPSKLIDYGIAGRPILNTKLDIEYEILEQFINGNYDEKLILDISIFDIKNVVNQFETIILGEN
ncbi:hypothetical protein [Turicibacter sanguinis]|uniref:hypothetical protein n=1 Tax=Turicibacter sanguinis TaxID=154288 RepID=UPI0018A9D29E|nr:hypothetical protein [Turicibacter sanguinis]MDB8567893.1 hypothetical protein [Turicibacter sanguinis]MDB8570642.1 hypothetical protein [Turicibacter sanguinis]MDB8573395.1 hypothetical protein [Turicibacter sanguinis]MDB8582155.1 hypothetical protein [Turicibacter sanguinis]